MNSTMSNLTVSHPGVIEHLSTAGIEFETNVALSSMSYMRTGGEAKLVVFPNSVDQMSDCIKALYETSTVYRVIGSTSNLLFLDDSTYGCLVSTAKMTRLHFDPESGVMEADAGAMLPDLSRLALFNSLTGLEGLEGIPGTVGGAIFMNAGAYGDEIKDTLWAVDIIHKDGSVVRASAAELKLVHRSSAVRSGALPVVIARCHFKAEPGNAQKIFNKMEVFHAKRHKYQDFMYPNLGSIFSGSPYRALGASDSKFRLISAAYYAICYEWKPFRRESPNNRKWLNDIVLKRFPLKFDIQPFSDKTLNCLVNRGQGTAEMCRFIEEMEALTKGRIPLENEVMKGF